MIGTANRNDYIGTGLLSTYSYGFKIYAATDLHVVKRDTSGNESVLSYPTNYSVTGVGVSTGGTIILTAALPASYALSIRRVRPLSQATDIRNQGQFNRASIEDELDDIVMIEQQLQDSIDRTIRVPESLNIGGYSLVLPMPQANKALGWDATGKLISNLDTDVVTPVSMDAANVTFVQAGAGASTRSVRARLRDACNVKDFGAVGDGATDDTAAINAAIAQCVATGSELWFPAASVSYKITANVILPNKVRCEASVTGNFQLQYTQQKNGWILGLTCHQLSVLGAWHTRVEGLKCDTLYIDGFSNGWGTYWNHFANIDVGTLLNLEIGNGPVNFNHFYAGKSMATTLTGTQGAGTTMEANHWDGFDFTVGGIQAQDTQMAVQYITNCWAESSAPISGNFHILGARYDASTVGPNVGRRNHILATSEVGYEGDFLAFGMRNLIRGGSWDWLDSGLKPVDINALGAWTPAVANDTTEPCGIGKTYGGVCGVIFSGLSLTVQPAGSTKGVATIYFKGTTNFSSVEINNGGVLTYPPQNVTVIDAVNNWRLLRVAFTARATATTLINLYFTGAAQPATFQVGGCFATSEKAVPLPSNGAADLSNVNGVVTVKGQDVVAHGISVGTIAHGANADITSSNNYAGLIIIQGTDGAGNDFLDVQSFRWFGLAVGNISKLDTAGAPLARTYSVNGVTGQLNLALAAGAGTYTIRTNQVRAAG